MALGQILASLKGLVDPFSEEQAQYDKAPCSPCSLHRLPVEIRHEIFRHCLENSPRASAPRLLVALRPDPQLYHEALAVFYGTNRLAIRPDNLRDVAYMPKKVMKRVLCAQISDGFVSLGFVLVSRALMLTCYKDVPKGRHWGPVTEVALSALRRHTSRVAYEAPAVLGFGKRVRPSQK